MSRITTHVLDLNLGHPGRGIPVRLAKSTADGWQEIASATTDADGRVSSFDIAEADVDAGTYQLRFDLDAYLADTAGEAFFPTATLEFVVGDDDHYHVPLLLSAYGYSTYRGS